MSLVLLLLAAPALAPAARPQESMPAAARALASCLGFTAADLQSLARSAAVVRTQPASDARDIAVAGVIRIRISPAFFTTRFKDIATFKRSDVVLQIGRLSDPPRDSDLASLTIDDDDVKAMRRCRIGDCGVKLRSSDIEAFARDVNWKAPDAPERARRMLRAILLRYAQEYLAGGDEALGSYDDKRQPVPLAGAFHALLATSPCAAKSFPDLTRWLIDFPRVDLGAAESFMYWSKENYGMKPVVSLTHVVMYQRSAGDPLVIVTKGVYTMHYVDASFGLTVLIDRTDAERAAIDVLYLNRSRVDTFGGAFGGVARSIVVRRQRSGAAKELVALKARLEAENSARGPE